MSPKMRHRILEDPKNTWNHQLMQACLQHNLVNAETLIENGADPVAAREAVPFYSEPLPPLVALVLRGQYTPEALAVMDWLVDRGASVSAAIPLHGRQFLTEPGEEGTLLHLLVQAGQPAMLVETLALIAEARPPPVTIIRRLTRGESVSEGASNLRAGRMSRAGSEGPGSGRRGGKGGGAGETSSARGTSTHGGNAGLISPVRVLTANTTFDLHVKGPCVDFEARTSINNLTVMDIALRRGEAQVVQLLHYYGCPTHFHRLVDGCWTPLARACAAGEREEAEALLDAGDVISQVSLDGRYTLIHYAAGQPAVLDMLCARGLGIDAENALGESALISLICYGQGINAENAIRETPRASDAARLAALPTAALRNYILTAMPMLVPASGAKMGKGTAGAGNGALSPEIEFPAMEPKADAWWYFATTSTWAMIQNLLERGADVHGDLSRIEREKVVQRTRDNKHGIAYMNALAVITAEESAAKMIGDEEDTSTKNNDSTPELSGNKISEKHRGGTLGSVNDIYTWPMVNTPLNDEEDSESKSYSFSDKSHGDEEEEEPLNLRPSLHTLSRLTPLMHAIVAYHPELIRRLAVEYRADPMVCDAQGACALHYAALACNPTVMELLISPLVVPLHEHFDINVQDCRGQTPLHYAAAQGKVGIVRALLTLGPTIHVGKADFTGLTALHFAVLADETTVVELLIHHSDNLATATSDAYSNTMVGGNAVSSRRKGGGGARRKGNRQAAAPVRDAPVLDATALVDVEAEDNVESLTALEMALRKTRHLAVARVLLSMGCASVRHASGLPRGGNLLHRVVHDGSADLLSLLLEHYADPTDVDDDDHTPLHLCAMLDLPQAPEMARELIRYGAFPEAQSGITLETPILIAARLGRDELLGVLLYEKKDMPSSHSLSVPWSNGGDRDRSVGSYNVSGGGLLSSEGHSKRGRRRRLSASDSSAVLPLESSAHRDQRFHGGLSSSSIRLNASDGVYDASEEHSSTHFVDDLVLANPQHLLLTDGRVKTALHFLCAHSDVSRQSALLPVVARIIQCPLGPSLSLQLDAEGRTPLHEACAAGFAAATDEILTRDDGGVIFFMDSHGNLPLHDAVAADDVESISAMAVNAAIWVPCPLRGLSAIVDETEVAQSLSLTMRLLQQKQKQKQGFSGGGQIPSGRAKREMFVHNVREFLNVPDGMGRTPLMLAAELGKRKAAAALVSLIRQHSHVARAPTSTNKKVVQLVV